MLTSADDFPIHQTPDPVAFPIGERNFYDRYFFNGYSPDGDLFFAVALGFYPQLGIVDGAFCVVRDGRQHNVRASRHADLLDRMDLSVGPLQVQVEKPLQRLAIQVDHDVIQASLDFEARCPAIAEPRFTRRVGGRLALDYTRLTQNGSWRGQIAVEGQPEDVEGFLGTRDRSWGIRPVGPPESSQTGRVPQFFWLWTPFNFDDFGLLYHLNADEHGRPWNESGAIVPRLDDESAPLSAVDLAWDQVESEVSLADGSRRLRDMTVRMQRGDEQRTVELDPGTPFFMSGLGYGHPEWGHGHHRGELDVGYDIYDLSDCDPNDLLYRHVQVLSRARVRETGDVGQGVIEQLILGDYAPLDLTGF